MKYLKNGEAPQGKLLKTVLFAGLLYLAFSHLAGLVIHADRIGWSYHGVVSHYLGSEEAFKNPVSFQGLLEITHMHMFAMGIAILLAGHLAAAMPIPAFAKYLLVLMPIASGLSDALSGWLIVYVSEKFAYLKIASLTLFEVSFALLLIAAFLSLKGAKNGALSRKGARRPKLNHPPQSALHEKSK
ncbi:MAG: hypothetical protein H3C68_05420 [Deltaproteobacteria bacterium]|nr:hypothetical protein [Deltaproteobacteria bacterium]MBZ0220169.1 hypothetical protein [Deltaproteobacteria bacterium]